jgi:biotin carboxylase
MVKPAGTLLMLGAGVDQLPAYHEALRRGYRLIAVDQNPDAPGAALANVFLPLSTRDTAAIAGALGTQALTGVVTTASDAGLASQRDLAIRYGLTALPQRAVRASMDKTFFRQVVAECGLPTYRWVADTDPVRLVEAAKQLPLPLVVKPTDASGGKGVALVTGYEQLAGAIAQARRLSRAELVTVEQYVEGRHYAVEIWMRDGCEHFVPVTEKRMTPLPAMVTTGHLIPARLPVPVLAEIRRALVTVCTALGITDGPANFDFVLTPTGELYLIEVGARLGGNAYPTLMAQAWGVDTVAATVSLAVGEPFDLTVTRSRACLLRLFASPLPGPAVLRGVSGVEAVREHPGVLTLELFAGLGDRVLPFTEAAYKVGYVVLVADDHDQLDALDRWCAATLRLDLEPVA